MIFQYISCRKSYVLVFIRMHSAVDIFTTPRYEDQIRYISLLYWKLQVQKILLNEHLNCFRHKMIKLSTIQTQKFQISAPFLNWNWLAQKLCFKLCHFLFKLAVSLHEAPWLVYEPRILKLFLRIGMNHFQNLFAVSCLVLSSFMWYPIPEIDKIEMC